MSYQFILSLLEETLLNVYLQCNIGDIVYVGILLPINDIFSSRESR